MTPLATAAWVLAAGGGGSSGFGGGGGGGGGSSYGGGGSSSGSGEFSPGVIAVVVVAALVFFVIPALWAGRRRRRAREQRAARDAVTRTAAAEAVEDDAHFAPEQVVAAADALFRRLQEAWDARDHDALRELAGPDLVVEWERRLADFAAKGWHNAVKVGAAPVVQYVGLENRGDDAQDRVVVAIECELEDYVVEERTGEVVFREGEDAKLVRLCEYWTLAWTSGEWRIDAIQGEAEGEHVLSAPLVPSPWSDEGRLRDAALVEGAVADAAPAGAPGVAELVDVDYAADARAAALDLSLVDGRFAPAVLEAAVRRALAAWIGAVDGADDELLRLATPEAVRELQHPDPANDRVREVVRSARAEDVRIVALDPDASPPELEVALVLRGRQYEEDRDTAAVVGGSRDRDSATARRLRFALSDADPGVPWRLVAAGGRVERRDAG